MKKILFAFLTLFTIGLVVFAFISSQKKQVKENTVNPVVEKEETTPSAKLLEYKDPAGFGFSYLEGVKVEVADSTDTNTYSQLKITSQNKAGGITVSAVGSNIKSISVKNGKKLKLADLEAVQYEEEGKITTAALDQGVLFTITADYQKDKEYWKSVNDKLIATFAFEAPQSPKATNVNNNQNATATGEEDVVFEGEETVE